MTTSIINKIGRPEEGVLTSCDYRRAGQEEETLFVRTGVQRSSEPYIWTFKELGRALSSLFSIFPDLYLIVSQTLTETAAFYMPDFLPFLYFCLGYLSNLESYFFLSLLLSFLTLHPLRSISSTTFSTKDFLFYLAARCGFS